MYVYCLHISERGLYLPRGQLPKVRIGTTPGWEKERKSFISPTLVHRTDFFFFIFRKIFDGRIQYTSSPFAFYFFLSPPSVYVCVGFSSARLRLWEKCHKLRGRLRSTNKRQGDVFKMGKRYIEKSHKEITLGEDHNTIHTLTYIPLYFFLFFFFLSCVCCPGYFPLSQWMADIRCAEMTPRVFIIIISLALLRIIDESSFKQLYRFVVHYRWLPVEQISRLLL